MPERPCFPHKQKRHAWGRGREPAAGGRGASEPHLCKHPFSGPSGLIRAHHSRTQGASLEQASTIQRHAPTSATSQMPSRGPLGFQCSRHRPTPRPSAQRIRRKALLPFNFSPLHTDTNQIKSRPVIWQAPEFPCLPIPKSSSPAME